MLPEQLVAFLDAANEFGEEFSDGAWMAYMEDAVRGYNQMNRTHFNPNKTVMLWMQSKEVR